MTCTRCKQALDPQAQPYHRTRRGAHHAVCPPQPSEAQIQQTCTELLEHKDSPRYGGNRTNRPNTAWDAKDGSVAVMLTTPGCIAFVDSTDYPLVEPIRWNLRVSAKSNTKYAYGYSRQHGKNVFMHKVVLGNVNGPQADHSDGDGLNNRRSNIRWATGSQNCANRVAHSPSVSGFRGVQKGVRSQKWIARIKHLGKTVHIGRFDTPEEAARAYDAAARQAWGEFAQTNFA